MEPERRRWQKICSTFTITSFFPFIRSLVWFPDDPTDDAASCYRRLSPTDEKLFLRKNSFLFYRNVALNFFPDEMEIFFFFPLFSRVCRHIESNAMLTRWGSFKLNFSGLVVECFVRSHITRKMIWIFLAFIFFGALFAEKINMEKLLLSQKPNRNKWKVFFPNIFCLHQQRVSRFPLVPEPWFC